MSLGKVNSVSCQLKKCSSFQRLYYTGTYILSIIGENKNCSSFQMLHYTGTNILSITEDKSTILKGWMLQNWFDKTAASAP